MGEVEKMSRRIRSDHQSPTTSRVWATEQWSCSNDRPQLNHLVMQLRLHVTRGRLHVTRGRESHASSGCTIPAVLASQLGASTDSPVAAAVAPTTPVHATGPSGVQPKK